jgi:hypothetical protein
MKRRRANLTAVSRHISEGRGAGWGPSYRPWLTIRDTGQLGVAGRRRDRWGYRECHVLSVGELRVLRVLEFDPRVVQIREQFPLLPIEATQQIAAELGYKHPKFAGTPIVMTTDFLVDRVDESGRSEHVAIAVKQESAKEDLRVMEKLLIEERYWLSRNPPVPWELWTEKDLNPEFNANLWALDPYRDPQSFRPADPKRDSLLQTLHAFLLENFELPLVATCAAFDALVGWKRGESLAAVRFAIAQRRWHVDLRGKIDTLLPPTFLIRDQSAL